MKNANKNGCKPKKQSKLFASRLQYAVTFSAGDELQGLFLDVTAAILYFRLFEILLHPVKVRAGIGIGAWTVKIENGLSTQQDGSAYHRARQAITEVHAMQLHNIRIDSDGDVLSNCLINASYTLKQQQNRMQNFALVVLELAYPFMSIRGKIPKNDTMVLEELLWNKFEWKSKNYYLTGHAPGRMESPYLGSGYMQSMDSVLIDGYPIEAEKVVRKKNMSLVVAEILGCTRQKHFGKRSHFSFGLIRTV